MGHGLSPGPIGIVLMPNNDAAVMSRLVEYLIVPKPDRAFEQLRSRDGKSRVPKKIVKSLRNSPAAQSMKEYFLRVSRFVRVEFVKKRVARMRWIDECHYFVSQSVDLFVRSEEHTSELQS